MSAALESGTCAIGNGMQVYWEACGEGRPVVFVHGLWASSRFFREQLRMTGKSHRAIALDLRGHGRSSMTPDGHTVPQLAADLRLFLRAMSIERPILVGWSMGAFIAWDYHRQFGRDGVAGFVSIDQAPTDFRYAGMTDALVGIEELHDWSASVLGDRNAFMAMVLPMMFATPPTAADADWMVAEMCRAPASVCASIFVDQCLRDYRATVPDYDVPTLVTAGGRSAQPRAGADFLAEHIPDARLSVFEDCGHCLFLEEPERFNRELLAFVAEIDAACTA